MTRALLLCLAVVFSLASVFISVGLVRTASNSNVLSPSAYDPEDPDYAVDWINLASGYFSNRDEVTKTIHIQTEGELANLNRVLTNDDGDYSGWTFILERDLDLLRYESNAGNEKVRARWTPINTVAGHNTGIVIDGNGYKISNLLIAIDDDATKLNGVKAQNGVGFFGNLTGNTIRNLVFENPVINYSYTGESKTADDPSRPTAPVKVPVGVVAGVVENAYVSDVKIVNPQVKVTTNNANGHGVYVGAAVGKMLYSDPKVTPLLHSLTDSEEAPEHHWGVDSVTIVGGTVGLTVTAGADTTAGAYGVAVNGYIGGVVGYNNSGKIINCKVKDLIVDPQMAGVSGTYYAGGIVGYTMLRVKTLDDAVMSGLLNNAVIESTVTAGQATHTGMLAGYVYDNWVYNNLYLGETANLYGEFHNRYYVLYNNDQCLGNLDFETFMDNENYFKVVTDTSTSSRKECTATIIQGFAICPLHSESFGEELFPYTGGDGKNDTHYLQYANQYNYQMPVADFANFVSGSTFNKLDDFENEDGNFYEIGKEKVEHEYQTEVNATNIRKAVNELRTWSVENGEPVFGNNLGYNYDVVFHANGENMGYTSEAKRANAGWVESGTYLDTVVTELTKKCKYKEPILKSSMPSCVGWEFEDWYEDQQCTRKFKFGRLMGGDGTAPGTVDIYAKWTIQSYTVTYYLAKDMKYTYEDADHGNFNGVETVEYGNSVTGPRVAPDLSKIDDPRFYGKSFTGNWYLMTTEYEYDESGNQVGEPILTRSKDWVFGNVDGFTPMPGYNIELYADFQDDFEVLRTELDASGVLSAFTNGGYNLENHQAGDFIGEQLKTGESCYTATSFSRFRIAYDNAFAVMQAHNSGLLGDEQLRDQTVDQIIQELRDAIAALTVDLDVLWSLPPLRDQDSDQNSYPFLYTIESYRNYTEIKRTALNYLNSEINNEGMLQNVERYLYIRDALMEKYHSLVANPYLGMNAALITEVKRGYAEIAPTIDAINPDDYTADSWRDAEFDQWRSRFKEVFMSNYQNQHIDDMKSVIDGYNTAKGQLVRSQNTNPGDIGSDTTQKAGGSSSILIGVLIFVLAVGGVGAYIGIDLYLVKKVKPKKEQAEKAEQAAAEDTYI